MKRTNRGFAIYTEVTDTYRNRCRVQASSAAGGRRVWIICKAGPTWGGSAPHPHLSPAQARRIAKALLRFAKGAA